MIEVHANKGWPFLLAYNESGQKCIYKTPILAAANNTIAHDLIKTKCVENACIKPMVQRFGFIFKKTATDGNANFSSMRYPDLSNGSLKEYMEQVKYAGFEHVILFDFMLFKFMASTPDGIIQYLEMENM